MKIIINANSISIPWEKKSIKTPPHIVSSIFYQKLLISLSYSTDAPPVGELLKRYYNLPGTWLIATPIYWEATHNSGSILAGGHDLNISEDIARTTFNRLEHFFNEEGRKLFWHDKVTWLLESTQGDPSINSIPPDVLANQSLMPYLQQLDNTGYWVRKITETQMLLSSSSINGIWIWGQGAYKTQHKPIYTNNLEILKLLKCLSDRAAIFSDELIHKHALMVFETLTEIEIIKLMPLIRKYPIEWHFNNETFRTSPKSWFRSLFYC